MRRTRGPAVGAARRASRRATVATAGAVGLAMVLVACGASGRDVVAGAWNGDPVSAKSQMEQVLQEDPKFYFAHTRLAMLLKDMKNYAEAEKHVRAVQYFQAGANGWAVSPLLEPGKAAA